MDRKGAPMLVLVVNAGSSSLKSQLIETDGKMTLMKCIAEKVGTDAAFMNVSFAPDFQKTRYNVAGKRVEECLAKLLEVMVGDIESPVSNLRQIDAIGNRIVAGGEYFTRSVVIDAQARANLAKCEELAPLHNPPADACIDMLHELMPDTPQVAVFDTAFHATMPPKAYMYPLPMHYYEQYHIRRYGAHGGSITAVNHGKSIDTTMGFTPLEGLMMGTRSGSIDPAIITYIMRREGKTFDEMDRILNKESGILGIAGESGDIRDALAAADAGNERAKLAIEMYVYRVQKAIGSYYAAMTRTDAVVMTAGIGENSAELRELIFAGLAHMGMILDKERNQVEGAIGMNRIISIDDSPIKICVVTADEEIRIARETDSLVSQL